jgi:hypothetical protein
MLLAPLEHGPGQIPRAPHARPGPFFSMASGRRLRGAVLKPGHVAPGVSAKRLRVEGPSKARAHTSIKDEFKAAAMTCQLVPLRPTRTVNECASMDAISARRLETYMT